MYCITCEVHGDAFDDDWLNRVDSQEFESTSNCNSTSNPVQISTLETPLWPTLASRLHRSYMYMYTRISAAVAIIILYIHVLG